MASERREFIPALREHICQNIPFADEDINAAIDKWRDGNDAESPLECGVFGVCDELAADLDSKEN